MKKDRRIKRQDRNDRKRLTSEMGVVRLWSGLIRSSFKAYKSSPCEHERGPLFSTMREDFHT